MNASINDSHNLAWKLVHVLREWEDFSLFKSYEFERQKYAQDLIDFDKTHTNLFSEKPKTKSFENGVSHEEIFKAFQTFQGFSSRCRNPIRRIGLDQHQTSVVRSEPYHRATHAASYFHPCIRLLAV